jgi:hypothetical protein
MKGGSAIGILAVLCLGLAAVLFAACEGSPPANPVVRFLDRQAAAQALLTDDSDRFFEQLTTLDLSLQLRTSDTSAGHAALLAKYRTSLEASAQSLCPSEQRRLNELFALLFERWKALFPQLPPPEVSVAKIDGRHYGDRVYFTRGNCIFVPAWQLAQRSDERLRRVLAHELLHVFGEARPSFREAGYALFGFFPLPNKPQRLPVWLRKRALTNPDAARYGYGIAVRDSSGRPLVAVPRIFGRVPVYGPGTRSYFDQIELRLFECVETADSLLLLDAPRPGYAPESLQGWTEQIGRNTDYVLHPEEILAENLAMLLLKEPAADEQGKQLLNALRQLCAEQR